MSDYKVISIYWNNDSNELMSLPSVRTATCGNDGMEVIGTAQAIEALHQTVIGNPDKFTLASGPRQAQDYDFSNAVDFSQGNFPEFETEDQVKEYLG